MRRYRLVASDRSFATTGLALVVLCAAAGLLAAPQAGGSFGQARPASDRSDRDDRDDRDPHRALFTHGPTDLANTTGVVPLGNLNPGGSHVLAVDHMYIDYPFPETSGAYSYPVYAMGDGEIVLVQQAGLPGPDFSYQIFIRHNHDVTSYFDHVHELSPRLTDFLDSAPDASWVAPPGANFRVLFPEQHGAPEALHVYAGESIGFTRSFSHNWDVGVIDARVERHLEGHGPRRYPNYEDFLRQFGYNDIRQPVANKAEHAACFIDYLTPSLKAAWFNPAVDAALVPPVFQLDYAALSIVPYNLFPTTQVAIGVGSNDPYAALDPGGLFLQLRNPFLITINPAHGARINPDPAVVGPSSGTVCYDLGYNVGGTPTHNMMLFRLVHPRRLAIKYVSDPFTSPQCASTPLSDPDGTWVVYTR